jgi:hypothetical protein
VSIVGAFADLLKPKPKAHGAGAGDVEAGTDRTPLIMGDHPIRVKLHECLRVFFNRYDVDNSGFIDEGCVWWTVRSWVWVGQGIHGD